MRANSTQLLTGLISLLALLVSMVPTVMCIAIDPVLHYFFAYDGIALSPVVSVVLLVLTVFLYRYTLDVAGIVLQAREPWILDRLVRDKE